MPSVFHHHYLLHYVQTLADSILHSMSTGFLPCRSEVMECLLFITLNKLHQWKWVQKIISIWFPSRPLTAPVQPHCDSNLDCIWVANPARNLRDISIQPATAHILSLHSTSPRQRIIPMVYWMRQFPAKPPSCGNSAEPRREGRKDFIHSWGL